MKNYAWIIACFIINMTYSQDCKSNFFGEIHDFHDGSPIIGATVHIETLDKYTVSDENGKFFINGICDGNITLVISHIGCETKRLNITIKGNTHSIINLEQHFERLNEVKLNGENNSKLSKTSQKTILKTSDIEQYSSESLGDALKLVSGVSSINTGNSIVKPIINGLHSSRIIVMTNGVRLQDQEWGIEHAPNIDINAAGSVSVIKGSNALAYGGDAIGGVVVLEPSKISLKDSLYGKTIMGGQSNGRGFNITTSLIKLYQKGWFVNAQASMKRMGDFEASNYMLTNTGVNTKSFSILSGYKTFEQGFNVHYSFLTNEIGILKASHIGNIEDLANAINSQQPLVIELFSYDINAPKQDITHQIIKADFYKRFKKFGRLELQYDFQNNQRFEYDVRIGANRNKPAIDLTLKTHTLKTNLKIDSKSNTTNEFGVNLDYQNNFANPDTGVKRLIPDYDRYGVGFFAISNLKLNDATQLDFGLRYDFININAKKFYGTSRWNALNYDDDFADIVIQNLGTQILTNPVFNYHNVSASAGISHQINNKNSVIFNYGLSNRAPNPSELFSDGLHHSAARIELGDLRMKQEVSNRISGSYTFKNDHVMLLAESFLNHISDYIFIVPTGVEQTIRGAFPVWTYNQTNALLYGLDVTATYHVSNQWALTNKSAFIKGKDLEQKEALIDMPAFKTINTLTYSNQKWWGFNAQLQSEWIFRQNDFPDTNFEVFIPATQSMLFLDVSTPPAAYHLLHLKSDITVKLTSKTNLNIGLNVSNIFNTTYREYLNRLRYFADDLGRNYMLQLKINY